MRKRYTHIQSIMQSIHYNEDELRFVQPFTMTLAGGWQVVGARERRFSQKKCCSTISYRHHHWTRLFGSTAHRNRMCSTKFAKRRMDNTSSFYRLYLKTKPSKNSSPICQVSENVIVLDDLMEKASNRADVAALFTHGRHNDTSVVFLTQNFFHKSKYARDMSLNIDYAVLFKNTRDPSMVTHLGQQMGNVAFLKQAYRAATIDPFSHLFIDMRSDTPEALRYRSNVLDETQTVYQPT